ncbi:hypothetical protein DPMN_080109 [Dreissena polymorpha]|uniref:Guanylate cyclase n=1 Tax=Dreissena polymorpha TaxID=45954 RepID=A0A9D4BRP2_DREPO|nr:hypothetical protein DPMN_080109 [Dreissena polymorpha]
MKNQFTIIYLFLVTLVNVAGKTATLYGAGASFPSQVYSEWINAYRISRLAHIDIDMRYEVVGSGEGKKRVMGKGLAVHYAGSDAMLTETEQANYTDLRLVQTLAGAVVLVFNVPDVSKLVLNLDVVTGIYNGTIQTWNHTDIVRLNPQIKLPDANIVPIARADDSGSTRVFTSALSSVSPEWRKHYGTFSEGYNSVTKAPFYWNSSVVKQFGRTTVGAVGLVLSTEFSLSYSSLSEVKSFSINHAWLQNSQGNIVNASIQSVQDAIVSADGNLSIVNTNGSFAYPLSTFTYFIVYMTSMTDCDSAIELVRYITWLSTSEQAAISADRLGFVALEKQTSDLIADHTLKMMTCKGQNVWELMLQQIALENALVEDDSWKTYVYIGVSVGTSVMVIFVVLYIKYQYGIHRELIKNTWRIPHLSIKLDGQQYSTPSTPISSNGSNDMSNRIHFGDGYNLNYVRYGKLNHQNVTLIKFGLKTEPVFSLKQRRMILWQIKTVSHVNVMPLVGLTQLTESWHSVFMCHSRGNLSEILRDPKFKFHNQMFVILAKCLVSAISYLHRKDIVHGRLTSKCCFIDSTWNLRVTAWNEVCIYKHSRSNTSHNKILPIDWSPEDESSAELLLFTAPEVIKYRSDVTPETDSYSLAMVYQEIFSRKPLYTELSLKPTEILYAVVTCGIRPRITEKTPNVIRLIMERCWEIDQASRPSTASIEVALHKEFPDTVSLLDCMTDTLEQYAVGLETKHNELKAEFEKIKNQINTSLYHNVPAPVADILLNNKKYQCTQYESICLMAFAVCHVENLVVHTTPTGFVNLMTHFFSSLDQVLLNSNLYCLHGQCEYNVYAIGMTFDSDATGYNATKAAIEAVKASKNIFNFTRKFSAERLSGINAELMLKFAITLGPAITGVVKTKQPKFSVFGKAMEEVRDLCANSSAGNIRLAPSVFQTFRAVNEETIHIQEVNEQKQYYIDIDVCYCA